MRKKEIEKIPYLGLKKISRKEDVKYIGVTAVKIIGNKKHLFVEVYQNQKEHKTVPVVRIVLAKKRILELFSRNGAVDTAESGGKRRIWEADMGRRIFFTGGEGR